MKRFRKYFLWTTGTLLALFLALSTIVYAIVFRNENQMKNLVIGELNQSLTGEVSVEQMKLTFWSSFPYVALDFRNVKAMGSNPMDSEPLLEAKRLSLNFNLRDVFYKKYEVKKIELSGATVRIKLYADGSENYNLWKSSDTASSDFSFALKKIQFKNTQLNFLNEGSEQRYELYFHRADAKGDFSSSLQNISFSGDLDLELLQSKGTTFLAKKSMRLRTQLKIDNPSETIHVLDGFIRLEDLNFDLSGFVNYSDTQANLNLDIVGNHLSLHQFIKQLPANFSEEIERYQSEGDFDFQLNLSGPYNGRNLPKIKAEWTFRNGQIYEENSKSYFNNVQFSGAFSTSNDNQLADCRLQIRDFSAHIEHGYLTGALAIDNFQTPTVRLNAAFSIGLEEAAHFISVPEIVKLTGLSAGRIQYKHTFNSFQSIDVSEILKGQFQGEILCKNVFCKLQDSVVKSSVRLDTASFKFNQQHLQISFAKGEFADSKFKTSLFLQDFWSHLQRPELMPVSGDLNVDKIKIDSILFQNLHTSIHYQKQILSLENFSTDVWDGHIRGLAEIDCSDTSRLPFRFDGTLSHINAEKILADFDNFDQTEITDKNLKGSIDADLSVLGIYLPSSGLDMKSLLVTVKTKISNGELNNVSMLKKLSRFVDEETLNHVKFATIENVIEIKNETVTFPEMKIRSNALNINVSGVQHFDGKIDYSIQIALSELLSKRRRERRKKQEESGSLNDEKKRTNLYVYVTGTTENPIFRYDIQNVFKKLKIGSDAASTAIKTEKETVKTILKEEFRFLQKSEETKRQEALWREQEKGKFVIEWDEDKTKIPVDSIKSGKKPIKKDTVKIGVLFEDD